MEKKITTIAHFRQLGGYKTKDGRTIRQDKIFRCGELYNVSDEELKILQDLEIKTVYDLRSAHEHTQRPDREGNYRIVLCPLAKPFKKTEVKYQNPISFFDRIKDADKDYANYCRIGFARGYMEFSYNKEALSQVIESLNRHETFLYHCYAGKDRTGVVSMLIMAFLGCDYETCKKDYLLHNVIAKEEIKESLNKCKEKGYSKEGLGVQEYYLSVCNELFDCAWYSVFDMYKSIEDYLEDQFGITKEMVDDWRNFYLE